MFYVGKYTFEYSINTMYPPTEFLAGILTKRIYRTINMFELKVCEGKKQGLLVAFVNAMAHPLCSRTLLFL